MDKPTPGPDEHGVEHIPVRPQPDGGGTGTPPPPPPKGGK